MPPDRMLVLACGALARELEKIVDVNGLHHVTIEYLPARLHNTPDLIPALIDERLELAANEYESRFVAYGDCGTGGLLDAVLDRHGVQRLDGAHCYDFYSNGLFDELQRAEPGTFYLTDYLTRHFDRLVWLGLGLDRHAAIRDMVFGNYNRLVYISQTDDSELLERAMEAAERLSLAFEHHHVGFGSLESTLVSITRNSVVS